MSWAIGSGGLERKEKLREVEEEIDEKAAQLWELTREELREIKRSLEELR